MATKHPLIPGAAKQKKYKVAAANESVSTSYANGKLDPEIKPEFGIDNAQAAQKLKVDTDKPQAGSTYTPTEPGENKPKPRWDLMAGAEVEAGSVPDSANPNDSVNISTIPNDIDPANGYLDVDKPAGTTTLNSDGGAVSNPLENATTASLGAADPDAVSLSDSEAAGNAYGADAVKPIPGDPNVPDAADYTAADASKQSNASVVPGAEIPTPAAPVDPLLAPAAQVAPIAPVAPAIPAAPAPVVSPLAPAIPGAEFGAEDGLDDGEGEFDVVNDDSDWDESDDQLSLPVGGPVGEDDLGAEPGVDLADAPVDEAAGDFTVMDLDGMDDDGVEGCVFAAVGSRLLVLKANRVIATISKRQAVNAGIDDVYMGDNFQDVTASTMQRVGIRAGLESMGFQLSTINIAKSEILNRRVEAKVQLTASSLQQVSGERDQCMEQCLAIASVGINKRYFKGQSNELAASLIANLQQVGIRNADRVVNSSFAAHGTTYAKAIVTLASKLADMPAETRTQFAAALDMLDDDGGFADGSEEVGDGDELGDDDFDAVEQFLPASVTASLARPGNTRVSAGYFPNGGISVTAHNILNSDTPLSFG